MTEIEVHKNKNNVRYTQPQIAKPPTICLATSHE